MYAKGRPVLADSERSSIRLHFHFSTDPHAKQLILICGQVIDMGCAMFEQSRAILRSLVDSFGRKFNFVNDFHEIEGHQMCSHVFSIDAYAYVP